MIAAGEGLYKPRRLFSDGQLPGLFDREVFPPYMGAYGMI